MNKVIISIYFTLLLTLLTAVPLVITVLDKSVDTAVFYNVNEGESNNDIEVTQLKIIPFYSISNSTSSILKLQKIKVIIKFIYALFYNLQVTVRLVP